MHAASSRETGWRFKAKSFRLLLNDQSREAPACIYLFEQLYFPAMVRSARSAKLKETCPQESLFLELVRTADLLTRAPAQLLKTEDLSAAQYNILRILRGEGKPLPILEIASRTVQVVPGITGLIDRLEQAGLVERQRCETDRRVIFVAITEKAKKLVNNLDQPLVVLHKKLLEHLTKSELQELNRLLEKVRSPLAKED